MTLICGGWRTTKIAPRIALADLQKECDMLQSPAPFSTPSLVVHVIAPARPLAGVQRDSGARGNLPAECPKVKNFVGTSLRLLAKTPEGEYVCNHNTEGNLINQNLLTKQNRRRHAQEFIHRNATIPNNQYFIGLMLFFKRLHSASFL